MADGRARDEGTRSWWHGTNLLGGGVAASTGPVLVAAGVLAPLAGGLLAIPLFVGGAAAVHAISAKRHRDKAPPPAPEPDLPATLTQLEIDITDKVPPAVLARVQRIDKTLVETLPRLDQLGAGSAQAHTVVQTAASYLPEALNSYLRLPRSYADRRPVSNGKTALMILIDQLDLLGNKMDEIFDAVCQADADALIAHGRFLADKFGSGDLALHSGPP